jgi:hypothetical protein
MIPEIKHGNVIVNLDLSSIATYTAWEAHAIKAIPSISSLPVSVAPPKISISIPIAFVAMGNCVRNVARSENRT